MLFAILINHSCFVRSDFIYDLVENLKPSVPAAGTKKSSRKRPTVSSQFKVCTALLCY